MKIKRILAGVIASAMAISAMAITASAADTYSAKVSIQFDVEASTVEEWEDLGDQAVDFKLGEETTIVIDLGADGEGKIANFFALETTIPEEKDGEDVVENVTIEIKSLKFDDKDVAFDADKLSVHSEKDVWRCEFYKSPDWQGTAAAVNPENLDSFNKIAITFVANVDNGDAADKEEKPADKEEKPADKEEKPAANPTTGMPIAGAGLVVLATASLAAATIIKKK